MVCRPIGMHTQARTPLHDTFIMFALYLIISGKQDLNPKSVREPLSLQRNYGRGMILLTYRRAIKQVSENISQKNES